MKWDISREGRQNDLQLGRNRKPQFSEILEIFFSKNDFLDQYQAEFLLKHLYNGLKKFTPGGLIRLKNGN